MLSSFDARVAESPDAVAVSDDDSRTSYAALDRLSRDYARLLARHGVGREQVVAIVASRGPRYIAMVLGVLRAGAAFLPVEPTTPIPRARLMCRSAGIRAVLAEPGHEVYASRLAGEAGEAGEAAENGEAGEAAESEWEPARAADDPAGDPVPVLVTPVRSAPGGPYPDRLAGGLAYVIFTSGSTGTPKGAMVTDRGMDNHLASKLDLLGLGPDDAVGFTAPLSFDISIWQILAPLCAGGRVCAAPAVLPDPAELAGWVERHGVTVLELVPSLLAVLLELVPADELRHRLRSLRFLIATGEALPAPLVRRWQHCFPAVPLVNAYGPTECADDVTHHVVTAADCATRPRPPIGREIANTSIYIVDGDGTRLPPGVEGELLVGGCGVGRGYLGDPRRTALGFVPDHLSGRPGGRLYRTGDRAVRTSDGLIDYLGRQDRQVKVRGHRVELGDVEAQLLRAPGVTAAACVLSGDRLYGFVTLRPGGSGSGRAVLDAVRADAPGYLVPHEVTVLERLPTSASGKVDYAALVRSRVHTGAAGEPEPDRLALARAMFAEVIGVPSVGDDDDFFMTGGDSLQAMRLMGLARTRLGRPGASLRGFMADPTPRGLVTILANAGAPDPAATATTGTAPGGLSAGQERLWFLEQLHPRRGPQLLRLVLTLHGPLDRQALQHALDAVVRRHEPLRMTFFQEVGVPVRRLWDSASLVPELVTASPDGSPPARPDRLGLAAAAARPPLAAAQLATIGPDHHVLTMLLHHLVADGWSLGVLGDEIGEHYQRWLRGDREVTLPPVSYTDYVAEERRWLEGAEAAACERYWRDQFADPPPAVELPWDRPRPERPSFEAASAVCELTVDQTAALRRLSRSLGATPFMAVMAAVYAGLRGLTGTDDLVLGVDAANRSWTGSDHLIGTFVNQLPVRLRPGAGAGLREILCHTREQCLGAYDHERLPFHRIVAAVNPPRRPGGSPLFQVKVTQQGSWRSSLRLPSIRVTPTVVAEPVTHLDLIVDVSGELDRLRLELLYPTEALEPATAAGWVEAIGAVLREAVAGQVDPAGRPSRQHDPQRDPEPDPAAAGTAPRTATEAVVAAVWCEVLELSGVSVTDNFFEVGGYSLAAVRVLHELAARTGVELDLETYFESETLEQVAAALDRHRSAAQPVDIGPGYEGEL